MSYLKLALLLTVLSLVAILIISHDPQQSATPPNGADAVSDEIRSGQSQLGDREITPKRSELVVDGSNINLIKSVYDADRTFRDSAIAEVERFMAKFDVDGTAVLRWEPVWIDADDLLSQHFLEADSTREEISLIPFSDMSFRAKRSDYRIWKMNGQASWRGNLEGGEVGTVKISILANSNGQPELIIRIHTNDRDITVAPTGVYGAYVAMLANPDGPKLSD